MRIVVYRSGDRLEEAVEFLADGARAETLFYDSEASEVLVDAQVTHDGDEPGLEGLLLGAVFFREVDIADEEDDADA